MLTASASLNKLNNYPIREFSVNKSEDLSKTQPDITTLNQTKPADNLTSSSSQPPLPQSQSANGLVRRLSVTARPGDIFYKVKDVTESSTTDTLNYETNETNVNDYAEIDNFNDEEKEIIIKAPGEEESNVADESLHEDEELNNDLSSPALSSTTTTNTLGNESSSNSFQLNTNRKTTTWNVKRHQTTSLGINPPLNEPVKAQPPKDDIVLNQKINQIEPGSPQFTKELLSIR
jgi:hypothetical protein